MLMYGYYYRVLPTWVPIHPSTWWCHCRQVHTHTHTHTHTLAHAHHIMNITLDGKDDMEMITLTLSLSVCTGVSTNGLLLCQEIVCYRITDNQRSSRRVIYCTVCQYRLACSERQYCTWGHIHTTQSHSAADIQYVCLSNLAQ